jgi:hypothetical protein
MRYLRHWRERSPRRGARATLLAVGLTVPLVASACTDPPDVPADAAATSPSRRPTGTIPQPNVSGLPVAPDSERVDLRVPTFSHPTQVTNPLFPVSDQASVLFLGHVEGKPFRTEVTLLPFTRVVDWEGQRVETLISQYTAYLDSRIQEVAYDLYAQADDGSVWYFGEDVSDFEDGAIVTKEGTWLAGKDAPAAMIMPGHPKVGDTYRTENSPGFAFEEVTVKALDQTLDGPFGPIQGGMVGQELHQDGVTEDKLFAPGYGEFYTADGKDVEALAMAVPTDASSGPMPAELSTMGAGWNAVFGAAHSGDWRAASAAVDDMATAWRTYRTGEVPRLIEPVLTKALADLSAAVRAKDTLRSEQLSIAVAQSTLDLELRYRPTTDVDLARVDLWAARVLADTAARDAGALRGDVFALMYIRDRILGSISDADMTRINNRVLDLQVASPEQDFAVASAAARQLRDIIAGLKSGG